MIVIDKITLPARIIGSIAIAATGYSLVKDIPRNAKNATQNDLANTYADIYTKANSASKESTMHARLQNWVTNARINDNFYPALVGAKNTVKSFIGGIWDNITTIALGAATFVAPMLLKAKKINPNTTAREIIPYKNPSLLTKLKHFSASGALGKGIAAVAAGLLAIRGAKFFIYDIWGIGKENVIKET